MTKRPNSTRELAKIHPDDPEIKNQLAVALRALKQRKQAYELFKEAPTPENLDERAQLAMELQRFDEAAELYKELAKIHPNDPEIKNQLAVALRALKQLEEAYKLFTEAPTPANLEARAELALQLKQYDDAARLYEELVALHPQNAQLRENLAYALDKGGQGAGSLDKAADQYAELIASGKASEETRVRYVWLLMREKRYDEAYQLLAAMPDTDPELLRLKAEAAFLSKRFAEAVPLLQQLSRTAPKDPEVWQNLAAAFDALKKPGEAAEALRQYLALAPADQGGSTRLAALLQRSGQTKEAIRIYKQILKTSPDDADALQGLATIYEAQSRYGAALDLLLRLARVQAPDAGLTLRIARLYKWKKEYATAQTWFRRALAMKLPGNERYLAVLDLAESELESGQGAEALRTLAALNPDKSKDPQLLELQARAAMADKKPARAVAALERLQRIRKLTATQQLWLAGQLRLLGENARALALYEALHKTGDLRSRDGLEALGDLRLDAGRAGDALRALPGNSGNRPNAGNLSENRPGRGSQRRQTAGGPGLRTLSVRRQAFRRDAAGGGAVHDQGGEIRARTRAVQPGFAAARTKGAGTGAGAGQPGGKALCRRRALGRQGCGDGSVQLESHSGAGSGTASAGQVTTSRQPVAAAYKNNYGSS